MSDSPPSTAALLQRAVALHQQGSFDAASALYQQVLAREPRQFDALHLAGVIARQQGDAGAAVTLIGQAIAVDGSHARAHCNLGAALADLGRSGEALASYERAIALDGGYALAHSNRGNALRTLGRLDDAIASYECALRLQPASYDAACQRAIALHDQGRHQQAQDGAEYALRLRPAQPQAWSARGNALHAQGDFTEALASFERAIALGGPRADVLGWRGGAQFKLGQFEAALASFEAALALRPDHAGSALRRAHALDALGRHDAAAAVFDDALALGADRGQVHFALAALGRLPAPAAAPAAYVTALFDQYADHFDAHLVDQLAYRTPQLVAAALERSGVSAGAALDVADLGCGTGLCGALLRPLATSLAGVDLSPAMLERARARGLYDTLVCADIAAFLAGRVAAFDLLVAADVLVYIGALDALFRAARQALRPGGRFCFSVELADQADFVLTPSRRYAHSAAYIGALAAANGLAVIEAAGAPLRRERGADVDGVVFVLAKGRDAPVMRDCA
ncbi:tetratricopeptide repeat protein [Massilia sp. DWR3-1-1]|uniref:tetratricopeptide repeat protein n=1 Tax=Massilia sp. DWR3-1-1 TaxID=2804559 RepID=UPI003CF684C8